MQSLMPQFHQPYHDLFDSLKTNLKARLSPRTQPLKTTHNPWMKAYQGPSRQLVLAFDIGTTFSGISYCLLEPGQEPKACSVSRYPGQEHVSGSCKIPTILCYDGQGRMCAAGAEALLPESCEHVEVGEWNRVEWFKLRLRPQSMPLDLQKSTLPPLPSGKTLVQIFGDFLSYLQSCVEIFLLNTYATLSEDWDNLRQTAEFVLCHPNGWEGVQQSMMRKAAISAKLVPNTPEGRSRVKFVTEGEASLHCCLHNRSVDVPTDKSPEKSFVIADLGGGTLDFSAYKVLGSEPLRVEEVSSPRCGLHGSTMVTLRARVYLKDKLRDSRYGADEHIQQIAERFDETAKKTFKGPDDLCVITFGSLADKDLAYGIRSGKLKIDGADVAGFFEPSIKDAVSAILELKSSSSCEITRVYTVGGFSTNPYMIAQLKERLTEHGISLHCPDDQAAKAAADGAVLFYIDQYVHSRIARMTYGVPVFWNYNDPRFSSLARPRKILDLPSGGKVMCGGFFPILLQGTTVSEEKEYRYSLYEEGGNREESTTVQMDIIAYRGTGTPPDWMDEPETKHLFTKLCTIKSDSPLPNVHVSKKFRKSFWRTTWEVVVMFGGTEMQAQIAWRENGIEKRSSAEIIFEDIPFDTHEGRDGVEHPQETLVPARDSTSAALLPRYELSRTRDGRVGGRAL